MTRALPVAITPLLPEALAQAVAIESLVQTRGWTAGVFRQELHAADRVYRAAVADGRLVGFGGLLLAVDEAHITNVAVHPDHQRQGIASRLLLSLLPAAVQRGARAATLEVRASNVGAQRLYSGFGFEPVGVRPRYYAEGEEDAIIMWAHDIASSAHTSRLAEIAAGLRTASLEEAR